MCRAVARLNSMYGLQFGDTGYGKHPFLSETQNARNTCAADNVQEDSSPLHLESLLPSSHQNGVGCQQNNLSGTTRESESVGPKNDRKKATRKKKSKAPERLLACPIRKHHELNRRTPTCTFKGAPHLSSITLHLKSRGHHQELPFVAVCRHCWEHTVSEEEYRNIHNTRQCRRTAQPRYDSVPKYWRQL